MTPTDVLDVLDTDALLKELKERANTEELQAWLETLRLQHAAGTAPADGSSAEGSPGSQAPYGWLGATPSSQEVVTQQLAQQNADVLMEPSKKRAGAGEEELEELGPFA